MVASEIVELVIEPYEQYGWKYRMVRKDHHFIRNIYNFQIWCNEHFEESNFYVYIGLIGAAYGQYQNRDAIYFKNKEDAVQFLLTWG